MYDIWNKKHDLQTNLNLRNSNIVENKKVLFKLFCSYLNYSMMKVQILKKNLQMILRQIHNINP